MTAESILRGLAQRLSETGSDADANFDFRRRRRTSDGHAPRAWFVTPHQRDGFLFQFADDLWQKILAHKIARSKSALLKKVWSIGPTLKVFLTYEFSGDVFYNVLHFKRWCRKFNRWKSWRLETIGFGCTSAYTRSWWLSSRSRARRSFHGQIRSLKRVKFFPQGLAGLRKDGSFLHCWWYMVHQKVALSQQCNQTWVCSNNDSNPCKPFPT